MSVREHVALWLSRHDTVRRTLTIMLTAYVLCAWAVAAAPSAAAATGAAALGWTGLHDADGVPLKDMFLSVVTTSEAVTNNGQEIDWNPASWVQWLDQAGQVWMSHGLVTTALTWQAAGIIYGAALSFWFLRFAMSNAYLLVVSEVAKPIHSAVNSYVNAMWLGPIALVICACIAGFHYQNGRPGRAWSIAGNASILVVLLFTFFRNPIDELTSEHGLLGMCRFTGFQIAQSVRGHSFAPGQSLDAQLDGMMAELISNTVRPMVQLMNFGQVVDDIPGCRAAWSAAVRAADGQGPGPAHAMYPDPQLVSPGAIHCNAVSALAHAQHLGANDIMLGALFLLIGVLVGFFIWWVGISTLLVGAKAAYYGIVVGPAFLLGMTGWQRPKNFATRAGSQLLLHGVETIIFTAFLAISSLGMVWALTTGLLARGEGTVVPRLVLVGIGSIVAILVFHYIDKHFYTDGVGTIAHHWRSVWDSGRGAVRSEYDSLQDGLDKARGLRDRYQGWRSPSGDDDDAAGGGQPDDVPGFDVVKDRPNRPSPGGATPTTATAPLGPQAGAQGAAQPTSASEVATTTATRSATTAEVSAAAETTAEVAAPEVAVPVAAGVAVAERVRGHGHGHGHDQHPASPEPGEPHAGSEPLAPVPVPREQPVTGPETGLAMAPTPAQRPTIQTPRHAAAHRDNDPSLSNEAGRGQDLAGDADGAPLEFPAATPRPAGTKGQR